MDMNSQDNKISMFTLERILAGEIDLEKDAALKEKVSRSPEAKKYLAQAPLIAEQFSRRNPTFETLNRRYAGSTRGSFTRIAEIFDRIFSWIPAGTPQLRLAGACMLVAIAIVTVPVVVLRTRNTMDFTMKGKSHCVIFVNGRQVNAINKPVACAPGDTVQLGIVSENPKHYCVMYRDDSGEIQTYFCSNGTAQSRVGSLSGQTMHRSIILDDGWINEEIFCTIADNPMDEQRAKTVIGTFLKGKDSVKGDVQVQIITLQNTRRAEAQ